MWIIDPKDGNKSVSLTLLVASFFGCVVGASLQVMGKIESAGIFLDLFYGSTALYFGRRFNIGGKTYSSDDAGKGTQGQ